MVYIYIAIKAGEGSAHPTSTGSIIFFSLLLGNGAGTERVTKSGQRTRGERSCIGHLARRMRRAPTWSLSHPACMRAYMGAPPSIHKRARGKLWRSYGERDHTVADECVERGDGLSDNIAPVFCTTFTEN